MSKERRRQQMTYLILNRIIKTGFSDLTMEDFVKMLPLSRATVYRYFNSRQKVISAVVIEYVNYIDQFDLPSFIHDENDWIVNVEKQLEAALVFYSHFSAIFLTDLKAEFPHEYQLLQGKIVDHNLHLLEFFRAGQEAGIFNSSKPELWILQDQLMVPRINAPDYLLTHKLTIKDAITSYVLMKSQQIIKPRYLSKFDPSFTATVLEKMNCKIKF
ncbi:MAG: TetR/AcrR family transcriptional regulator [Lactobacillus sp.]|nr:TetR/AcrR family transcriptional regulator [Lactobacillus sp.]